MTGRRWFAVVVGGLAVLGYLAALGPLSWAVTDSSVAALFELLGTSSPANSVLCVMYLVLTLVVVGLTGAGLFSLPPRDRWYAVAARLVWLLDLACVTGIGWRIARGGVGFGPGWYLAVLVVLMVGAAALAVPTHGR